MWSNHLHTKSVFVFLQTLNCIYIGSYLQAGGVLYEGDWVDDKQHGHGKETWPDGAVYEGQFANGK